MSRHPPRPRARALRVTYALLVAWFVVLSALAGVAAGDAGTAVLGLALFAPGFGAGRDDRLAGCDPPAQHCAGVVSLSVSLGCVFALLAQMLARA